MVRDSVVTSRRSCVQRGEPVCHKRDWYAVLPALDATLTGLLSLIQGAGQVQVWTSSAGGGIVVW